MNDAILRRFVAAALICILLTSAALVSAQAATPISIGENQLGSVAAPNGSVPFSLSVASPQSVEIQVLAVTSGFAPTFRVLDPGGAVVLEATNAGAQSIAQGMPNLFTPGAYRIEVSGVN